VRIEISHEKVNSDFVKKIEEISGENIFACYQCGKCSAGCPLVDEMDLLPNQVMRLVQLGQEKELLGCRTIWLCASCLTCFSRCPKGVDLAKVMEAIRVQLTRSGTDKLDLQEVSNEVLAETPQLGIICSFRKFTG